MRILVIEDEEDLANAIAKGLRKQGYAVDTAFDGELGWETAEINDYDLLILDLNLPGLNGLEVCRRLRSSQPRLLILMLTARSQPNQRVEGLDLGADDYLVKPFHWGELMARVRALLRRKTQNGKLLLECGDLTLDPTAQVAALGNRQLQLTGKEFSILEYLMRHHQQVVAKDRLMEQLYPDDDERDPNVIEVLVGRLRRKLEGPAGFKPIDTVRGLGYLFNERCR